MASTTAIPRILLGTTGGVTAYGSYKARYDPPHLVWDLDSTILCSITPLPPSSLALPYESFEQIDDDFPFEGLNPNTRTYWRPGARTVLQICRVFAVQHVFTAAQETYTENILQQMDRSLFHTIIHRDIVPQPKGKDLQEIIKVCSEDYPNIGLNRCILFDDRTKNFRPQNGENGVHVVPFEATVEGDIVGGEYREMARWLGIAALALLVPDVCSFLPYFRSEDHNKRFSSEEQRKM